MQHKALNVKFDTMTGRLLIDELNQFLADGWLVDQMSYGSGCDILVIIKKGNLNEENA